MRTFSRWLLLLAALVLCLGSTVVADASPVPTVKLAVDRKLLVSGETVVASARASANCSWLITWGAAKQVRTGRVASATFTAPVVTRPTRLPLRARCFVLPAAPAASVPAAPERAVRTGGTQRLVVTVPASGEDTVTVTVLPPGNGVVSPPSDGGVSPGGDGLPDAGGPGRALLVAGLASLLGGVLAVRYARRSVRKSTASSTDR